MSLLRALLQPTLVFVAILLAAAAQYLRTYRQADLVALSLCFIALIFAGLAIATSPVSIATRLTDAAPSGARPRRVPRALILSAAVLAILTFFFSTGSQFTADNLLAWGLSIVVFFYAFWEPEKDWQTWNEWLRQRAASARDVLARGVRLSPTALGLCAILLVGVFFYFHNLDGVPAEMDSDHAEKLLDVNDVVNGDLAPIFFERNTGREPLQFYLTALFVKLADHPLDYMALKLMTATLGLLVIPGTFLFVRELFDDDVALFAAAWLAIGKWPVTIARMGLRFPLTPVFIAPLMFFLLRGLKYQRRNDFLMAGLFLGAGLYGYNAFRLAPLLVIGLLGLWLFVGPRMDWSQLHRYAANSALMFACMFVVLMPLLRYGTEHPDQVVYRMATRLVGEGQPLPGNPAEILATNVANVAVMFNWTGDSAWPNSVLGDPALDYVSGGLFLLGLALALYRMVRYRQAAYAFVLIGLATMLLPSALSLAFPNENPSLVRAGGAIPFVFVIVALPLAWFLRAVNHAVVSAREAHTSQSNLGIASSPTTLLAMTKVGAMVAIAFLFAIGARANFLRYFRDLDQSYREYSWNASEVAAVIRGFAESVGDVDHAWILLYPHWVDTRNVAINLGQIGWEHTLPSAEDARAYANDSANQLYVLNEKDSTNLELLQRIFPRGQPRVFHARTPGHDFIIFYVPGTLAPNGLLGVR